MTTQQMELAAAVEETGSISKAAEKLFLSQSNASGMIKALEYEVEFQIFYRSNAGVVPTEQGEQFLKYVRKILKYVEEIRNLKNVKKPLRFCMGFGSYTPIIRAFEELCEEYAQNTNIDFSCRNVERGNALKAVSHLQIDFFAGLFPAQETEALSKEAKKHNAQLVYIRQIPIQINLRKGHPLDTGGKVELSGLAEYPYVGYCKSKLLDLANACLKDHAISAKYKITVDERSLRCKMVSTSDAFSVGAKLPQDVLEKYNMVSYPIEGVECTLCAIMRKGEENRPEICRYLEILQEKLADI